MKREREEGEQRGREKREREEGEKRERGVKFQLVVHMFEELCTCEHINLS